MNTTDQPKRPRFQFRLRTLLIVVFLLSLALSGIAVRIAWTRMIRGLSQVGAFQHGTHGITTCELS